MELWTSFWLGMLLGTFGGTAAGVLLTCLMVAARRELEGDAALSASWEGRRELVAGIVAGRKEGGAR